MLRAYGVSFGLVLVGCRAPAARHCSLSAAASKAEALAGTRLVPLVESQFGGVSRDDQAERRMRRIGRRLAQSATPLLPACQYRLLRADCRNAVSLPGGYIYVTQGLYRVLFSDDLLAATQPHELAHLAAKDHFKHPPRGRNQALKREQSADAKAAALLEAAGFHSQVLIDLLVLVGNDQPPGWARARANLLRNSTHHSDTVASRAGAIASVQSHD